MQSSWANSSFQYNKLVDLQFKDSSLIWSTVFKTCNTGWYELSFRTRLMVALWVTGRRQLSWKFPQRTSDIQGYYRQSATTMSVIWLCELSFWLIMTQGLLFLYKHPGVNMQSPHDHNSILREIVINSLTVNLCCNFTVTYSASFYIEMSSGLESPPQTALIRLCYITVSGNSG